MFEMSIGNTCGILLCDWVIFVFIASEAQNVSLEVAYREAKRS
jgi:hypothetical protein